VKAIVVASGSFSEQHLNKLKEDINAVCAERLIPYARPSVIEFRESLPLTLVGKIDYVVLEKEESERSAAALV
jgi:long-chain acyl-CoA synthetase